MGLRNEVRPALGVLCLALHAAACAPPRAGSSLAVTVVVSGDERLARDVRTGVLRRDELPVDVRVAQVEAPAAEENQTQELDVRLRAARQSYYDGDTAACLDALSRDGLGVELLGRGRRSLAARVLFWRTACLVGEGNTADAARAARQLFTWGLEPPAEDTSPLVTTVLEAARAEVAAAARVPLALSADALASVAIDGGAQFCELPCVRELPAGEHVLRLDGAGLTSQQRVVRLEGPRLEVVFTAVAAPPALAQQQWRARYAWSAAIDSGPSVALLSTAVRARHLVLLMADDERRSARLRGVLAVEGRIVARGERDRGEPGAQARALLGDLLHQGRVVVPPRPVVASPWFWLSVVGAAALATGVSVGVATQPVNSRLHLGTP